MKNESINIKSSSLDILFWKEEILQVMYWLQGEGIDETVPVNRLQTLLNTDRDNLIFHLKKNVDAGYLINILNNWDENQLVKLTPEGKKEGGKLFASAFEGLQKVGHGECGPECDCQAEGHDACEHHNHKHEHKH